MSFVFPPATAAEGAGGVADGEGVEDMSKFPFKTLCYAFLFFMLRYFFLFFVNFFFIVTHAAVEAAPEPEPKPEPVPPPPFGRGIVIIKPDVLDKRASIRVVKPKDEEEEEEDDDAAEPQEVKIEYIDHEVDIETEIVERLTADGFKILKRKRFIFANWTPNYDLAEIQNVNHFLFFVEFIFAAEASIHLGFIFLIITTALSFFHNYCCRLHRSLVALHMT